MKYIDINVCVFIYICIPWKDLDHLFLVGLGVHHFSSGLSSSKRKSKGTTHFIKYGGNDFQGILHEFHFGGQTATACRHGQRTWMRPPPWRTSAHGSAVDGQGDMAHCGQNGQTSPCSTRAAGS